MEVLESPAICARADEYLAAWGIEDKAARQRVKVLMESRAAEKAEDLRWDEIFFEVLETTEDIPALKDAARELQLRPHPDLQRAAMVPQPLDLGPISVIASMKMHPVLKAVAGVAWLFGLILAAMFLFQHI